MERFYYEFWAVIALCAIGVLMKIERNTRGRA